jgi:hypothetical protein
MKFGLASLVALIVLLVVNLFVFPLVFGSGVPLPYSGLREEPLYLAHGIALALTAVLLVAVCANSAGTPQKAMLSAAFAGLLASLPSALHTFAMVDISIGTQIAPIAWTVFTWTMAGSSIGIVLYGRRPAKDAPK